MFKSTSSTIKHYASVAGAGAMMLIASSISAQTLSVGSNPQGSLAYSTAAGVAKVVNDQTDLKLRVVPQGGPVVTLPLVENGELDFSIAVSLLTAFGNEGRAMFKGRAQKNVRIVAALFPLHLGLFVRDDSPIKSVADLKGKRMSSKLTKQKAVLITRNAKIATAGLKADDVVGVPAPNGVRQVDDFLAGKIDAVSFSLKSGKTAQAHAKVGIRVLSLPNSPDALKRMQAIAPGSLIETIQPGPAYPGVTGPTNIFSMPFVLTASANTPDDVVHKVTAALAASKDKLVAAHKAFAGFDPKKMKLDLGLPYHPGALKFYKEQGL